MVFSDILQVNFVVRGPLYLAQFAVYVPANSVSKREAPVESAHSQRLGHVHGHHGPQHAHFHHHRAVGDEVIQTMNGQVVSWVNEYDGHPATRVVAVTATINGEVVSWATDYAGTTASTSPVQEVFFGKATNRPTEEVVSTIWSTVYSTLTVTAGTNTATGISALTESASSPSPFAATSAMPSSFAAPASSPSQSMNDATASVSTAEGDYTRQAYYDAASQEATGLTFLGNYGGQGSGKWTSECGNTLSYISSDGSGGASSSQILST